MLASTNRSRGPLVGFVSPMIVLMSLVAGETTARGQSLDASLESLKSLYQNLATVRLEADLVIEMHSDDIGAPEFKMGDGSFSYLGSDSAGASCELDRLGVLLGR